MEKLLWRSCNTRVLPFQRWFLVKACYDQETDKALAPKRSTPSNQLLLQQPYYINCSYRASNVSIRSKAAEHKPAILVIIRRKISLFGHICWIDDSRLNKCSVFGMVEGSRSRGRSEKEWIGDNRQWFKDKKIFYLLPQAQDQGRGRRQIRTKILMGKRIIDSKEYIVRWNYKISWAVRAQVLTLYCTFANLHLSCFVENSKLTRTPRWFLDGRGNQNCRPCHKCNHNATRVTCSICGCLSFMDTFSSKSEMNEDHFQNTIMFHILPRPDLRGLKFSSKTATSINGNTVAGQKLPNQQHYVWAIGCSMVHR